MNRLAALLLACTALPAAVPPAAAQQVSTITPAEMRAHVDFLADDLLEGRDAGTRGYDIAARYVATRFDALGLKPAGDKGSWYQMIRFQQARIDPSKPAGITIGGTSFAHEGDALISPNATAPEPSLTAPAVFVGYGLDAPAQGLNDYAGADVKGKIVIILYGTPKGLPSELAAHLMQSKIKTAQAKGAVGVVQIATPDLLKQASWARLKQQSGHPRQTMLEPDGTPRDETPGIKARATITGAATDAVFAGGGTTLAKVLAAAARPKARTKPFTLARPVTITRSTLVEASRSPNVVGVLAGADPRLASEYVLLTAHLDHNGVDPALKGDTVYNGAMDNAAGIATMLEAARAFATSGKPPKRSVMFVALTSEEDGLLGSDYLARHPLVGNGRVVADVNLDMPVLLYPLTDVVAFGAEHSTVGEAVARAAAQAGLKLSPDPMPEENVFVRSDHYSFVKQGVPSVMLATGVENGGGKIFRDFLATQYHKVSDQPDLPFNWESAAKFAWVNYLIARDLADAAEAPRWYAGSPFGNQFAKDQPKAPKPTN